MADEVVVLHPTLVDLKLNRDDGASRLSAVRVLNHLIVNEAISADAVRLAHAAVLTAAAAAAGAVTEIAVPPAVEEKKRRGNRVESKSTSPQKKTLKRQCSDDFAPAVSQSGLVNAPAPSNSSLPAIPAATAPLSVRRRHIALRIYYDGGAYSGLAENVGTAGDTSIERALFAALVRAQLVTNRADCGYSRCGRTDKGVSAAGQVVALRLKSAFALEASLCHPESTATATTGVVVAALTNDELPKNSHETRAVWVPPKQKNTGEAPSSDNTANQPPPPWIQKDLSEYAYDKILNNLLPPDVRVLGWTPVTDDFSARFSCASRTYRYFFVPPRHNSHAVPRMRQGLRRLVGTHDFRNFCKMDVEKVYNFERTIHAAEIVAVDSTTSYLLIVGQAFLWHQIRCIAHVLFLIGRGLEEPAVVSELLDVVKNPGKPSYALADERPLVLHDCQYSNLSFGYSVPNLWHTVCLQEQQWADFLLAAARVRNCIESLRTVPVSAAELSTFCESKRKHRRKNKGKVSDMNAVDDAALSSSSSPFSSEFVTWSEALDWLQERGLTPEPDKSSDFVYTALLERVRGTTYDEKVAALQHSTKRRQKFEDNVIKKRKTKEEDAAFYQHMTMQGGSAV